MSAQLSIDWNAVEPAALVVAPSVTMAPSAIQARRSGRQRVVSKISARMDRYRNAITLGRGHRGRGHAAAGVGA